MDYLYTTIRNQICQNDKCPQYKSQNMGNVVVHSQKEKRVRCTTCMQTWVVRKYTIFYRLKTDTKKINEAMILFDNGQSIREIAKNIEASPSTIMRWKKLLNI